MRKESRSLRVFAALVMLALSLLVSPAAAHTIGLSTGEYTAKGNRLAVKLAFARGEVAALVPSLDDNRDGHITAVEVANAKALITQKFLGRIVVTQAGAACSPATTDAALTEEDGLFVTGRFECARDDAPFDVDVRLVAELTRGHRHVARAVSGETTHDEVLDREHRTFSVPPSAVQAKAKAPETEPSAKTDVGRDRRALSFFSMGIEHILTGYDHLVFLLGLVLVGGRVRSIALVVTAFTVAHSITLAIAVLGVWSPSPRIVEPAIALSIAYVGIENFFVKDASKRWRITFPFGLVHGFGFAGALSEVGLPKSSVPAALVAFNFGVEIGQLAVLAVVLPILVVLRRRAWFDARAVPILSAAIAGAGVIWFVGRLLSG